METFCSFCKSFLLFLGISKINDEDCDLDELEQELEKLNIGKILSQELFLLKRHLKYTCFEDNRSGSVLAEFVPLWKILGQFQIVG